MKLSNLGHNLLEPIYFIFSKFYSRFTYKTQYEIVKKNISNKNIFIIATGPSLDEFNFKKIKNSTFILINASIEILKKIPKNNIIFWSTSDVSKIHDFVPKLPDNFRCLVTSSKYRGIIDLIRSNHEIIYFHSQSCIFLKKFNFLSFFKITIPMFGPKILNSSIIDPEKILRKNIVTLPGGTSVLFVLIVIMKMSPKSINLVGFDIGSVKKKHYSSLKYHSNKKISFDVKYIKTVFKKILVSLKKRKIKLKKYSKYII